MYTSDRPQKYTNFQNQQKYILNQQKYMPNQQKYMYFC